MPAQQPARSETGFRIIPRLAVSDVDAAARLMAEAFGFASESGGAGSALRVRRANQVIELTGTGNGSRQAGAIHHLALVADDVPAMAAHHRGQGRLEGSMPAAGFVHAPQMWGNGVDYTFIDGPDGAIIEYCRGRDVFPVPRDLAEGAHDHIGVMTADIAASIRFYRDLGFEVIAEVSVPDVAGPTEVAFVDRGAYSIELFSPAGIRKDGMPAVTAPLWSGLILSGASDLRAGTLTGPGGERITIA